MLQEVKNTAGVDPRCGYCGRPIVNTSRIEDFSYIVHGRGGSYHPECTRPPEPGLPIDLGATDSPWWVNK